MSDVVGQTADQNQTSMGEGFRVAADRDRVHKVITDLLTRLEKPTDGLTDDTGLWGDGLELDSLEAAELSTMLEDEFGADPFSEGDEMPETVADIVAFYGATTAS